MGFVQGPVVPQLRQDEEPCANFDSETLFNYFGVMEKSAALLQLGGLRAPSSDGHADDVIRPSSRRQSANSKLPSSKDAWVPSKNYVSEQKRRKKLNNSLLELRALVPKITKMDKASIIGDTITYLKDLNRQIEELEKALELSPFHSSELERSGRSSCSQDSEELERSQADGVSVFRTTPKREEAPEDLTNPIKVVVTEVEDEVYKLTITCKLQKISLLEVSRVMEGHFVDIICSSFSTAAVSCCTTAICVFVVKMCSWTSMALEDLEWSVLKLLMSELRSQSWVLDGALPFQFSFDKSEKIVARNPRTKMSSFLLLVD